MSLIKKNELYITRFLGSRSTKMSISVHLQMLFLLPIIKVKVQTDLQLHLHVYCNSILITDENVVPRFSFGNVFLSVEAVAIETPWRVS